MGKPFGGSHLNRRNETTRPVPDLRLIAAGSKKLLFPACLVAGQIEGGSEWQPKAIQSALDCIRRMDQCKNAHSAKASQALQRFLR